MAGVQLEGVLKRFGAVEVIKGVDLDVKDGEFCVFVGPSGCGKSTLLRMIAGLEEISAGRLTIGGADVTRLDPSERGVAMVFQSYALYPHMTVADNIGFGLKMTGHPKAEIEKRVSRASAMLQLDKLLDRKPSQLSGGQRQRVAIGRAIVRNPGVFLFDEPLSNLDAALRVQMRAELGKLHQDLKTTMIYVTHDQVEAMTMADRIVVLRDGRIEQVGSPLELYHRPANLFVAGFIGSPKMNLLRAMARPIEDGVHVRFAGGAEITLGMPGHALTGETAVTLGIRPEHASGEHGPGTQIEGTVRLAEHLGSETIVYLQLATGEEMVVKTDGLSDIAVGQDLSVTIPAAACHLFDGQGRAIINGALKG